jgi:Fe-S-cluster formation regulator IscX/YfhJ
MDEKMEMLLKIKELNDYKKVSNKKILEALKCFDDPKQKLMEDK